MTDAATKPDRDAIVEALMALAAERPWDDIELGDIVEKAGITLAAFRAAFPSKGAVLAAFARKIDMEVLDGTTEELADEPARERLFDVYMRRIDALAPYKTALKRINFAVRRDPMTLAALNRVALNSQRFMLAAAGIPTEDSLGPVRIQGAVLVFANVMETWYDDDSPELARTMARLDRELKRGERTMERVGDAERMLAPVRALADALLDGGRRLRRDGLRGRRRRGTDDEAPPAGAAGEMEDPAAAI
ncbi:TetR family transcriptional regulator [Salinarimonas ramus]|uniref:HTH tetR-type domain-containing protein n=1 Tax=Salinarimonas ramus TaxID=690164 RepID=A0A917V223_9HYPH|nr:TetR family transcriptional regulator [Salinarimonas ramus]GGK24456.1 hypothetical protein GCM10011322_08870 [Salinarimonas ramus]